MLDAPFHRVQVEFSLTGDNHLFQFLGIFHEERGVFLMNTLQYFGEFFLVARVGGTYGCSETGIRVLDLTEFVMNVFLVQRVAVVRVFQFNGGADISCHHFRYFRAVFPGYRV